MLITYIAKKVNLKDNFKNMVDKKLSKFDRLFSDSASATVKVAVEKNRQTVEITINDNGMIYRSENTSAEMNEAVDKCVAILGRQIRKNKTKLEKRLKAGSIDEFIAAEPEDADVDGEEAESYDVYRVKTIPTKPMLVDEAILRMNMVNHQFFMFTNAETSQINVVYKRADGKYGLLIPEEN
ncbi:MULTISPECIES: ribosome hibernation-promoting factor, HPF/YfiA family [unclassified Ruminococcus]|uniref:ribosome hibernation-promoting factor, HPF/YfiA family n=1 Tax=unclassified Ruminococcus TaxID=2608920 RepID=UPI00210917DD|nr:MULTISPECIES: ribosome-associated translation inhibitor RaiA [unclassified Ruminococcus]MCQ4021652.1 ribosome-associated translation inhibitor RaiA [Ruminococcus sp. zg-924]MCQ4114097.1 ribosome-associated translation inhibitor RaiA [Ruminococcus sp. zg-921]